MTATLALSLRYLCSRPLVALLNLLLLTLGLAAITFVLLVAHQVGRAFERDLAGIDVVVGAKGSPLQLILAGVFQIDVAPGNIPLEQFDALRRHPQLARVVPISMGDSFRGHRIVGTTPEYLQLYRLKAAQGTDGLGAPMQALVGAVAARATGLTPGARFVGNHGLSEKGHAHGDTPFTVAGVLALCGCVADRLILTALESVWQVHETALATDEADRKLIAAEREVTMALISYRTPLAAVSFPRQINAGTMLQAAAPAVEVTRLARLVGAGAQALHGFGAVLLAVAALSVFSALWNAVRERRADMAMLRMLGARPARVAALVACEALWLAAAASVLGLVAGHAMAALVGWWLAQSQSLPLTGALWLPEELWVPALALAVALLAALLPAWGAGRVDVARLLQQPNG